MATGVTLGELLDDLRAVLGSSLTTAHGRNQEEHLKRQLRRSQRQLFAMADWGHRYHRADVTLAAGSRYYDVPATLDYNRIEQVDLYWSGEWHVRLPRGIGMEHYAQHDSDIDERYDPQLRWELVHTGVRQQIEVWPIPATNGATLRCHGARALAAFVAENDVCTLDGDLIVLHAALAGMAADRKSAAYVHTERQYAKLLNDLKRRAVTGRTPIPLGEQTGMPEPETRDVQIRVVSG